MEVERCSGTILSIPHGKHKVDVLVCNILIRRDHLENIPVILRLHGILGNLLDDTQHFVPRILAKNGYSSLTMNTLMANLGLFYGFGIYDDAIQQIDSVCDFLRGFGFKKIVLSGHGLGGCMAISYAAMKNGQKKSSDIKGIIAVSTPYSMPDAIRRRWERFQSEPAYEEVLERAERVFKPRPGHKQALDETVVVKRAHGPTNMPQHTEIYTLKTWWALAGPEADGAKTYKHIQKIRVPILLVHGLKDDMIEQYEFEDLGRVATEAGNKDVTHSYIDSGHTFARKHTELGQVIVNWLDERFRKGIPQKS